MKHWLPRELDLLRQLRTRFLEGTAGKSDYWRSDEELRLYDSTFAERIGWKIDGALRALDAAGWRPESRRLLDWGCGTGIATRRLLVYWPGFESVGFVDRSPRAVAFARRAALAESPGLRGDDSPANGETLLLISHVLSELDDAGLQELLGQVRAAGEVIWVESGTHANSRRLIEVRQRLLADENPAHVVGPCTHQLTCGLLAPQNAQHWCHFFAKPPPDVFQDAQWAEFSRAMGIDLRALPFSLLALSRRGWRQADGSSRVLGGLRENKGYCKVLNCNAAGVHELMLQKRDVPEAFKILTKRSEWPLFRWTIEGEKIVAGEEARTNIAAPETAA